MVTRPLDINSKLSRKPRSYDWVFFVNIALIAMFFAFFGSRFVLSPALVISGNFNTPARPVEQVSYVPGTVVISVKANGQIFTDTGLVSHSQLRVWFEEKIKQSPDASLLIRTDASVTIDETMRISEMARTAGFKLVSIPVEPTKSGQMEIPPPGAVRP